METWYVPANPVILGQGPKGAEPVTIVADVGTGDVQIQFMDQAEGWFTPTADEYTIAADDVFILDRSNCPPVRILASGDAVFQVWGVDPTYFEAAS